MINGRQQVSGIVPGVSSDHPSHTRLADGPQLDAFGRLRTSEPTTVFDAQQEYGLDTLRVWDAAANGTYAAMATDGSVTNGGNAVGPRNANTRMTPVTVSTTNGEYSVLQSRQYVRYIPGKSHLVFITGVFAPASGFAASIVRRTSTSGSVVDTTVAQADWNIDTFGAGAKNPSSITIDFTKTQILVIQAQWLGVGRVIVGFDIDGVLYPAHEFLNANTIAVPYTQTFNLPVRLEARNTSATTTVARAGYFDAANGIFVQNSKTAGSPPGGTLNFVCCSVQSEGGTEIRGFPMTANNGIAAIGVSSRRAVLSIRPKATFNSLTNRAHIELADFQISAQTNDALYEVVIGGTLGGVPAWTSVGTNSTIEYDVAGTTVTGGVSTISGHVVAGSGVARGVVIGTIDIRNPFVLRQIDALAANQDSISIVCTAVAGTSNILSAINWHEQTV